MICFHAKKESQPVALIALVKPLAFVVILTSLSKEEIVI